MTDPQRLTTPELIRYARREINAGSLNTNWHREVVDRLERLSIEAIPPNATYVDPRQLTLNF